MSGAFWQRIADIERHLDLQRREIEHLRARLEALEARRAGRPKREDAHVPAV